MSTGLTVLLIGCVVSSILAFIVFAIVTRIYGGIRGICYALAIAALIGGVCGGYMVSKKLDPDWNTRINQNAPGYRCTQCGEPVAEYLGICQDCQEKEK